MSLNGQLVQPDVLGHQQLFERTVLYNTYEAPVRAGTNTIGVEVGNGWYGSFAAPANH